MAYEDMQSSKYVSRPKSGTIRPNSAITNKNYLLNESSIEFNSPNKAQSYKTVKFQENLPINPKLKNPVVE